MAGEIFTEPWIEAWGREVDSSAAYREAAADWEGSICMLLEGPAEDGGRRAAFLDLHHGRCRDARPASEEEIETADFVLAAKEKVWRKVVNGGLDPVWGLMSGRLRLKRGSLARLTPHAAAARELLNAAQRVSLEDEAAGTSVVDAEPATTPPPPPPAEEPSVADRDTTRRGFQTTGGRGLDWTSPPMQLFQKAKKHGIWDPMSIDLHRDAVDWRRLSDDERDVIWRLSALFQAGEEAVTLDLLPLIQVVAAEGRLEEEIYLTSFLWEEAKHVEAFRRFLDEVTGECGDLSRYHGEGYRRIFYEELPRALGRLGDDASPVAQAEASVIYNMIVEGVLAETGYRAYESMLERNGILPGMLEIVGHLRHDESRHLAYGVYLLSRLVAEHGEPVWEAIEARMGELLEPALDVVRETFDAYDEMPFGLEMDEFTDFASDQFRRRIDRIEKARGRPLEEVLAEF